MAVLIVCTAVLPDRMSNLRYSFGRLEGIGLVRLPFTLEPNKILASSCPRGMLEFVTWASQSQLPHQIPGFCTFLASVCRLGHDFRSPNRIAPVPRANNGAINNSPPRQRATLVNADSFDCVKFVCVAINGDYIPLKNDLDGLAFGEIM